MSKKERELADRAQRARETAENLEKQIIEEGLTKDLEEDSDVPIEATGNDIPPSEEEASNVDVSDAGEEMPVYKMKLAGAADQIVRFDDLIKEIENLDFHVIQIDSASLGRFLSKFIAIGSIVHKLSPDDLTIIANLKGNYDGKETANTHQTDGKTVPNTLLGLLANRTKFFDAVVYLGMEHSRRPKPIELKLNTENDEPLNFPTYDDMSKLTSYIFIMYFYIIIRAHPPIDNNAYQNPLIIDELGTENYLYILSSSALVPKL